MVLRRRQCTHASSSTPLPGALQKVGEIGPSDLAGKLHLLFHFRENKISSTSESAVPVALVPAALVTTLGPAAVVSQSLTSSALIPTREHGKTYEYTVYKYSSRFQFGRNSFCQSLNLLVISVEIEQT